MNLYGYIVQVNLIEIGIVISLAIGCEAYQQMCIVDRWVIQILIFVYLASWGSNIFLDKQLYGQLDAWHAGDVQYDLLVFGM